MVKIARKRIAIFSKHRTDPADGCRMKKKKRKREEEEEKSGEKEREERHGKIVKVCGDGVPLPGRKGLPGFPSTLSRCAPSGVENNFLSLSLSGLSKRKGCGILLFLT